MENDKAGYFETVLLLRTIMQPAIAGGMTEDRAMMISEEIVACIDQLGVSDNGETAFEGLLEDINKILFSYSRKTAIGTDDETTH